MGRQPTRPGRDTPFHNLALYLFELRERKSLTPAQLAQRLAGKPGCSAPALCRMTRGRVLPKWGKVEAFVVGCGGDQADLKRARALWEAAASPQLRRNELLLQHQLQHHDLIDGLRSMVARSGLTQSALLNAGVAEVTSRSALSRVLCHGQWPSLAMVKAIVKACGYPDHTVELWARAWCLIGRSRQTDPTHEAVVLPVWMDPAWLWILHGARGHPRFAT
ncbi:helix-turn-helix transcriptional regulator [Kitasatospora sp. NPDC047058]|uniref:helix-turn-helix domain-containing protein n=1 Tax=Kitasatospora sp. NPDC047058 TaxID=3155620 RepID=UPI0033C50C04